MPDVVRILETLVQNVPAHTKALQSYQRLLRGSMAGNPFHVRFLFNSLKFKYMYNKFKYMSNAGFIRPF